VTDPQLILADEPTGNLDSGSSHEILAMLRRLNQDGRTVVLITHDAEIARTANRVVRMLDGRVVEGVSSPLDGEVSPKATEGP
jgi:putative ABC transport system ATP-binding protein